MLKVVNHIESLLRHNFLSGTHSSTKELEACFVVSDVSRGTALDYLVPFIYQEDLRRFIVTIDTRLHLPKEKSLLPDYDPPGIDLDTVIANLDTVDPFSLMEGIGNLPNVKELATIMTSNPEPIVRLGAALIFLGYMYNRTHHEQ